VTVVPLADVVAVERAPGRGTTTAMSLSADPHEFVTLTQYARRVLDAGALYVADVAPAICVDENAPFL